MLQALLHVAHLLALAHAQCRELMTPRRSLLAEVAVLRERLECARAENAMLRARLRRVPARRRPHYLPFERLDILWHAGRYGLSVAATARTFVVSVAAVKNWRRDLAHKLRRKVRGKAPMNKLPQFISEIARRLKRDWPRLGTRKIAGMLARLGLKASRTSVQAFLRRPMRPAARSRAITPKVRAGHVIAKHPGHVWFIDFTHVGDAFRSVVVGAVVDGFSRKVLALRVAPHEPSAAFAVRLVREAARKFGRPETLVSDHGTQLTADEFRRAVAQLGVAHRFGAIHRSGSIARIERFWKSLKVEFASGLFLWRPLPRIERMLQAYAAWFNAERPHQGLGQRTPHEIHFGTCTRARAVPLRPALVVMAHDAEGVLPVVRWRHAA